MSEKYAILSEVHGSVRFLIDTLYSTYDQAKDNLQGLSRPIEETNVYICKVEPVSLIKLQPVEENVECFKFEKNSKIQ